MKNYEHLSGLTGALHEYLMEKQADEKTCLDQNEKTVIHLRNGKSLELYRLFKRSEDVASAIRNGSKEIDGWESSSFWRANNDALSKMEGEVTARMERHHELLPLVTKGISWEGRPVLIHAYKFETDPNLKLELVAPDIVGPMPELPAKKLASLIRCHEYLVPPEVALPLAPYDRHEAKFQLISDYLRENTPPDAYNNLVLQHDSSTKYSERTRCHSVEEVGSRRARPEYLLASHFLYGDALQAA